MQVDFSAPILDLNGQPLVDDNGPVNLGVICLQALLANTTRTATSAVLRRFGASISPPRYTPTRS